jgi:hypothetical protein
LGIVVKHVHGLDTCINVKQFGIVVLSLTGVGVPFQPFLLVPCQALMGGFLLVDSAEFIVARRV